MNAVYKNFLETVEHKEPSLVPVAMWDNAISITHLAGIEAYKYYRNPKIKLETQLAVMRQFPEILWIPGIWADYGVVPEASAFGCKIQWFKNSPPYAHPVLTNINAVDKMMTADPSNDGLMPEVLHQYRYFWKYANRIHLKEYHYLNGLAVTHGPLELAGLVRGYNSLPLDLVDHPSKVHKLLEILTETIVCWLKAQQDINGKLRLLIMVDHYPSQISQQMFEEFGVQYMRYIFGQFPSAIHLYHNEGQATHILEKIPKIGTDIFHCGKIDLETAKEQIGKQVCLMGNLDPIKVKEYTSEEIKQLSLNCLKIAAPGGGYILSNGGAMAPGTSKQNIQALIKATKEYSIGITHVGQ